jgi:murein DD-endopeptidase MepM/ murein hydrolase activator NlpD
MGSIAAAAALLTAVLGADPRARLEALKARSAAEQAAARSLQQREGSLLGTLEAAERALRDAEAAGRQAEETRAVAERQLKSARAEEASAQSRLTELEAELSPRLRARARLGASSELWLLASSTSLAEMAKNRHLWDRIAAHDLALLREARDARAARERARVARAEEAERIAALAQVAADRREAAAARRAARRDMLAAVRDARELHERAALEAAEQSAKLAAFLAALPPPSARAFRHSGFALLRGLLPYPAKGSIEVGFGRIVDSRFNTVTVHKGLDIRAPQGAAVRAVAPGRVAHAGWFRGYGNLIIIDHGDGYHTLVAHLASMSTAIGEEVQAGSLLGTVGDTGSLKGPYLYFEIREKGRPVDPRPWLRP